MHRRPGGRAPRVRTGCAFPSRKVQIEAEHSLMSLPDRIGRRRGLRNSQPTGQNKRTTIKYASAWIRRFKASKLRDEGLSELRQVASAEPNPAATSAFSCFILVSNNVQRSRTELRSIQRKRPAGATPPTFSCNCRARRSGSVAWTSLVYSGHWQTPLHVGIAKSPRGRFALKHWMEPNIRWARWPGTRCDIEIAAIKKLSLPLQGSTRFKRTGRGPPPRGDCAGGSDHASLRRDFARAWPFELNPSVT